MDVVIVSDVDDDKSFEIVLVALMAVDAANMILNRKIIRVKLLILLVCHLHSLINNFTILSNTIGSNV